MFLSLFGAPADGTMLSPALDAGVNRAGVVAVEVEMLGASDSTRELRSVVGEAEESERLPFERVSVSALTGRRRSSSAAAVTGSSCCAS